MKSIEWMAQHSYLNCHAEGVDSLRIDDKIRCFIATSSHTLYKNNEEYWCSPMSVGYHPHHCDLSLYCLEGSVKNIVREPVKKDSWEAKRYYKYKYNSEIIGGKIGFQMLGADYLGRRRINELIAGTSVEMRASQVHTVYVPRYEEAIWVVEESMEDLDYKSYCWSDDGFLDKWNFDKLYGKPTVEETLKMWEKVKGYL